MRYEPPVETYEPSAEYKNGFRDGFMAAAKTEAARDGFDSWEGAYMMGIGVGKGYAYARVSQNCQQLVTEMTRSFKYVRPFIEMRNLP